MDRCSERRDDLDWLQAAWLQAGVVCVSFEGQVAVHGDRVLNVNEVFDYILLCNKICGASHYNMQMPLVVTDAATHDAWYAEAMKKPFQAPAEAPAPPTSTPVDSSAVPVDSTAVAQVQQSH